MTELKPCPFCGDAEDLTVTRINGSACYWCFECESCDYNRYIFGAKQEAIKIWNTRPAEDALKAEVERLKAALHSILQNAEFWDNEDDSLAIIHRIATDAIGTDTNATANAPDTGKMEEK